MHDNHNRTASPDVHTAARRLYDAEIALHIARSSGVDAWIAAASDRLHEAVEAHTAVLTAFRAAELRTAS